MADNIIAQPAWHWCDLCGSLWHASSAKPNGFCAAPTSGGKHSAAQSGNYLLLDKTDGAFNASAMVQTLWHWCNKCDCLWHSQGAGPGVCPAGGAHSATGSGDYALWNDSGGSWG